MLRFWASVTNETLKLFAKKKTVSLLILSALLPFVAVPLLSRIQNGFGVAGVSSSDFPLLILNIFSTLLIPLFAFMAAADMFAAEVGDKTIRMIVTRPITRIKIYSSKHAALLIYIVVYLIVAFITSVVSSAFLPLQNSFAAELLRALVAYFAAAVPLFTLGALAILLSQFFKNASGALTICILLYALSKLISFLFPAFDIYSPAAYTNWYLLWIGTTVASGKIVSTFMFLIACCILFFTAGYYFFDKKEF